MGYSFNFKDLKFDFSDDKNLSHRDFMLSEFFKASTEVKEQFKKAYLKEYGVGPYNHMMNNFWYRWKNGSRVVSDTQSYRIYKLMPNLLDNSAKHRLGMNEFMISIKRTVQGYIETQRKPYANHKVFNKTHDVIQVFMRELEKIQSIRLVVLKSYILSDEEKEEALKISKYILEVKLQQTFDQIERDFNIFLPFMFRFKGGIYSANYSITNLNIKIDIAHIGLGEIEVPRFKIKEIQASSRFKKYSDKYLAYELVSIHHDASKSVKNSFLNSSDLQLFFIHYDRLSKGGSEVSMNSTFQGEGGVLDIKAQMKPLKVLKTSIVVSAIKLSIYFIVALTLVSWAINRELFTLLFFGSIYIGINTFSVIREEISLLKSLTKEYKTYG